MHPLLPTVLDARYDRETIDKHPLNGETRAGRKGAQGNVQTITIRAVCTGCNNGWMSKLEGAARPALTSLVLGQAVTLQAEQVAAVARWIALKCMVAEHASPGKALTPREDREALRASLTIPSYYRIYLAPYHGESVVAYQRHSLLISLAPKLASPLSAEVTKNVQTVSFFMGRVFVHVNAARIENFDLESRVQITPFYPAARIFPPFNGGDLRRPVDREGASLIAHTLQAYLDACDIRRIGG